MSPRRIMWIMRAMVYVPLALVAVAVFVMRGEDAPAVTELHDLSGATTQGRSFELRLHEDGSIARMAAPVELTCNDGVRTPVDWSASDDDAVDFAREGDRLRARHAWAWSADDGSPRTIAVAVDGRMAGEQRAEGVVEVTLANPRERGRSLCRASVRWRAKSP